MSNCKVIALTSSRQAMLYRHAEASACLSRTAVSPLKITTAVLGCDFVFDADAQANLTMSLGWQEPDELPDTLSTVMQNIVDERPMDIHGGILHHPEGVDLMPSSIELSGLEVRLIQAISRERVPKTYVNAVRKDYDYVLIDCTWSEMFGVVIFTTQT